MQRETIERKKKSIEEQFNAEMTNYNIAMGSSTEEAKKQAMGTLAASMIKAGDRVQKIEKLLTRAIKKLSNLQNLSKIIKERAYLL